MPAPAPPKPAAAVAESASETAAAHAAAGLPLLDRVLEELSPASLAAMACVCAALRGRCPADALWERHLRGKWGSVLGAAVRKEGEAELAVRPRARASVPRPTRRGRSWVDSLACAWPFSSIACRWLSKGDTKAAACTPAPAAEPAPAAAAPPWLREMKHEPEGRGLLQASQNAAGLAGLPAEARWTLQA